MKKIIYSLLFAALFSACSTDFLDRNPLDKPSNEAFWRTEKDAKANYKYGADKCPQRVGSR